MPAGMHVKRTHKITNKETGLEIEGWLDEEFRLLFFFFHIDGCQAPNRFNPDEWNISEIAPSQREQVMALEPGTIFQIEGNDPFLRIYATGDDQIAQSSRGFLRGASRFSDRKTTPITIISPAGGLPVA